MFHILAADELAAEGLQLIRSQPDAVVESRPGLSEEELGAIVGDYDGLIVRSGAKVTAAVLAHPGRLKVIARAGVGVDNIDLDAATAAGILVLNAAEASTITTAEHTMALMLAAARYIGPAYESMCQGHWNRTAFHGRQLAGKTLGIVGFGRIGQAIARRALAFEMTVCAYDPFINASTILEGLVRMYADFEDLLPNADVLTFHVPLNDQTRRMLDAERLTRCRDGVLIINASRGGVVDEEALLPAIASGKISAVGLDVFQSEPLSRQSPLRGHQRILLTPHLGASTVEAQQAISTGAAAAMLDYLRGHGLRGAVNVGDLRLDLDPLQACFGDLANRMARLINPMISAGITGVTLEVCSRQLWTVASTLERMSLVGLLQAHLDVPLNLINVTHIAEQRGIAQRTITSDVASHDAPQLILEVAAAGRRDNRLHRIVGRVYDDRRPRIVEINGYHMDMIPDGCMVLIQNDDQPGMVGLVGIEFGQAQINIADMAISRRDRSALMVLKVDAEPPDELLERLGRRTGIRKVAMVKLVQPVASAPTGRHLADLDRRSG